MDGKYFGRDGAVQLTRRQALQTLGAVGVTGAGLAGREWRTGELADGGCEDVFLPSIVTHGRYHSRIRDSGLTDEGHVQEFHRDAEAFSSNMVAQTNLKVIDENDSYENLCGDQPGIQHRFVAAGLSLGVTNPHNGGPPASAPIVADMSLDAGLVTESGSCDTTTVSPNYILWDMAPAAIPSSDIVALFDEHEERVDRAALRGEVDQFLESENVDPTIPADNEALVGVAGLLFGKLASAVVLSPLVALFISGAVTSAFDAFLSRAIKRAKRKYEFEENGMSFHEQSGASKSSPLAIYVADFTVTVPEGESATFRIDNQLEYEHEENYFSSGPSGVMPERYTYEVSIPANYANDSAAEATPAQITQTNGPITADPSQPVDFSERDEVNVEFRLCDSNGDCGGVDPSLLNWNMASGGAIESPVSSTTFDMSGVRPIEVGGHREWEFDGWEQEESFDMQRTFQIGDDPCARPKADFVTQPTEILLGEEILFDAVASTPTDEINGYRWRRYLADDPREPQRPVETDELDDERRVRWTFETARQWIVELTVENENGIRDTVRKRFDPIPGPSADIAFEPSPPLVDEPITFYGSNSASRVGIADYNWDIELVDDPREPGQFVESTDDETYSYTFGNTDRWRVSLTVTDDHGVTDATNVEITPKPIHVTFDVSDTEAGIGETIVLDASDSRAISDLTDTDFEWTLSRETWDGETSADTFTGEVADFTLEGEAKYYDISLSVTDSDGNTGTAGPERVSVDSSRPTAQFDYEPSTVVEGETVTFDASDSSGEGELSYTWEYSREDGPEGGPITEHTSDPMTTFTFETAELWNVTLTVEDELTGRTDSTTQSITPSPNDPDPTVAEFTHEPSDVVVDEEITFDASASSSENALSYSWAFYRPNGPGDGSLSPGDSITTYSFGTTEQWNAKLEVEDQVSGESDQVEEAFYPREPDREGPTASISGDGSLDTGESGDWSATGSSAGDGADDGPIVSYEWGGAVSGTGTSVSETWYSEGSYTVQLTVEDSNGETDTTSMSVDVESDEPDREGPTASVSGDSSLDIGETGSWSGSGSSAGNGADDGAIVSYSWGGDVGGSGTSTSESWSTQGSYTVTLTVTDSNGLSDSASMSVGVHEADPYTRGDKR